MTEERMSPGRILREERERQGLGAEEVAGQMRLSRSQVEALEADDHAVLPGNVFVRGFIRNYAKLLHIDPDPLLESIDMPKESIEPPKDEGIPFPSGRNKSWVHYAIGFVLLAFSVLVYEMSREDHVAEVNPRTAKPVRKPEPAKAHPLVSGAAPVSSPVTISSPVSVQASVPAAVPASVPVSMPASSPAAASGPLRLSFDAAAWVEVRDANGRIVFSRLSPAGSEQHVSGQAPFSLTIGNAQHVRVDYLGKPVDLAPYIKTQVAHLTLK